MARRKHSRSGNSKKDFAFHLLLLAWPVIQFCVFYIYVNINSIALAFNFGDFPNESAFYYFQKIFAFEETTNSYPYLKAAGISVILFLCSMVISVPLALLFGYYISRKFFGSKFFRFILFMPSILSETVMICIFKKFNDIDLQYYLIEKMQTLDVPNLLNTAETKTYVTVVLFDIFIGFGTTTLIYANRMSEISPEVFEAAKLDGANRAREFFSIVLPFTFPTLTTFLITSLATIFTNQYCLFTFFSSNIGNMSPGPIGYIIYNNVQSSAAQGIYDSTEFHQMAALGLVCTAVTIPVVFGVKFLLEKFGPKER